ncbi:M23 family metallopeptidase [Luteimonas terricola]|uniref:Membrane protein n=1 Tax=Luteimonas terricola TaxID=645597 RepID=A0ABQ2EKY8_9GAMM|nr:peptidoglycan DD-metalloendopeptidase family protein [Luteimonas terricola]GGK15659.1 membrane protein [Luteimonas terricola]
MTTPESPHSPDAQRSNRVRLDNLRELERQTASTRHQADTDTGTTGNRRWSRRQWAHASLAATAGALLLAIVPGFNTAVDVPHSSRLTTLSLSLPAQPVVAEEARQASEWLPVAVEKGQTLGAIFDDLGIPAATMHALLKQPGARDALTRLRPGAQLGFAFDLPAADGKRGALRALRYDRNETERVELALAGGAVVETVIERPIEVRTSVVSGEVGRSLFHSARKLGLSGSSINKLTDDIFQYDIDFNTDVAASDRFSVVVEQVYREGELLRTGDVLAAVFTAKGKPFTAFRFEHDGKTAYYNEEGRPLKKSFIRMPIQYARLSSRFGSRRHPVSGNVRQHKGVDYAARTGTPIMAAGDARVQFKGWRGGYGNTVILDHGRGYTTLYAHMSGFGNIRQGQRVSQGTVIGRVGSTGLSTGPHLHYEFRINGVHRNPLQHTMPEPEPLKGTALIAFKAQTGPALARIRTVEDVIYAQVPAADDDTRVAAADRDAAVTRGRG